MDDELEAQLTAVADRLNAGSEIRLYKVDVPVTYQMELADFVAADYPGYAAVDLTGLWSAPVRDHTGAWSIISPWQSFAHGGEGSGQTVFGVLVSAGDTVRFAGAFPGPVLVHAGGRPLEFAIEIRLVDAMLFLSLSLV